MKTRVLTVSLLFAVLALPAYGGAYAQDSAPEPVAQDNPQTRQTDEAEDDYRRSQRRRDTGDIFEDIGINPSSGGSGSEIFGREVKAIDRLDQESRRHLNKQRAKALAEANPGEPIDAAYEPSETAKTDEYVASQEKEAWEEMMRDANSGLSGTGDGQGGGIGDQQGDPSAQGQPGGGQLGQSGQAGQGQSGQGQSGQPSTSPLRGGSASSASSILDQIKGRSRSGTNSGGSSGSQQGQSSSQGQASSQGQSSAQGQTGQQSQGDAQAQAQAAAQAAAQAQAQADAAAQAAAQAQAAAEAEQAQGDAKAAAEAQAQAAAQAAAEAKAAAEASAQAAASAQAQAQAEAQAQAQAEAEAQAAAEAEATNAAAEAAAHHETMSPLERLKRDPVERDDVGGRTSASDYLNRKKD